MRYSPVKITALAAVAALSLSTAKAAIITATYTVSGSNFSSNVPSVPPPFTSITESFTVTFDTTMLPVVTTNGISLNASTITPTSPLGFQYVAGADTLIVGGTAGAGTVTTSDPASTDFAIFINNASKGASYGITSLSYSVGSNAILTAGTTAIPAAVPEPTSLALLGAGAATLAFLRRRRRPCR